MFVTLFAIIAGICVLQAFVTLRPQKAEVLEGGSVLLTCIDERNRSISHWTWSSYDLPFNLHIHPFTDGKCNDDLVLENIIFYSVYCNKSSTSLLLQNVTKSRHGERWECDSDVEISNSAIVYVIVPVTSVLLYSTGNTILPKANSIVHLSCSTSFARPEPNITWYFKENTPGIEDQTPLLDNTIAKITASTELLFSTRSEILLHVNHSFDGRRIYCSASNYPGITVSSANILLNVQYIVSFFVKGFEGVDIVTVVENDTVQFTCLFGTVAKIAKLTYHWKTVLVEEFDTTNLTYTLHRVSCRDSGVYTCTERYALNGKLSIEHLTLLVKCPPYVRPNTAIKENMLAKPGVIVTISLDIIAYPEPRLSDFVWMKLTTANWILINNSLHTEISVLGLQTNLTINSVTEEDFGKYRLTVINELGSYSHNFTLEKVKTKENTNVIAIVVGSVVGFVVLVGIISAAIFLIRKANHKREFPCISIIMKWKGGQKTSMIWKTSSSAAVESNENSNISGPRNIYEQLQRNGEVQKEYQEIQLGGDDKCVYKNIQLHPPPATS